MAPNKTKSLRVYAYDLGEDATFDLDQVQPTNAGWANYLLGVIAQFQKAGHRVEGLDLVFGGNVPSGAGLSSSAAAWRPG